MCKYTAYVALELIILQYLTLPATSLSQDCAKLATLHAWRYQIAVTKGSPLRKLTIKGLPTPLVVWGGDDGTPAAAAAAILHVALRYGLGYDAEFRLEHVDVCNTNTTPFSVSPAVYVKPCSDNMFGNLLRMSGDTALVPLRAPLLASAAAGVGCTKANGVLPAYDNAKMRSCSLNLTLHSFNELRYTSGSELPQCHFSVNNCTASVDNSNRVVLAAATAGATSHELEKLHKYICEQNLSLSLLLFDDTSCFRQTLHYLDRANYSFLFFDKDLWMYKPEMLSVLLKNDETDTCPIRDVNNITDLVQRIGDGIIMWNYAPQIAQIVERFCPSLKHLKEILVNEANDAIDIETAACKWALKNNVTFEQWITNAKRDYRIYIYVCANDPLNAEYKKTIEEVIQATTKRNDFEFHVYIENNIDCYNEQSMKQEFHKLENKYLLDSVMGLITWSSSNGIKEFARHTNHLQLPLILVGPITPDTPTGPSSSAINGGLDDIAYFYRAFLNNCGWKRLAILSEDSTYAKAFTNYLVTNDTFNYIETVVTFEVVTDILTSLRSDEVRIFIVNTNSSVAVHILQSAIKLGMTPPQYAWIVREWSPTTEEVSKAWGDMTHFSFSTTWRGSGGRDLGDNATLSGRLQKLWPGVAWPALAAPLAEAISLLVHSFSVFHQLYSANSYSMRNGGYAMNFTQIYDKTRLPGVDRELSFRNGNIETVIIYLERWRGGSRTVLASWNLQKDRHREIRNESLCGALVQDRPVCNFPAREKAFKQICYDIPLYVLFTVIVLLPVVFVVARRARLKRLAVRDLKLLAHILESKQLTPIVQGDSLSVHRIIGTGNFGSVYLATLRQSRENTMSVAAKELRSESDKEEYLQEAGTLQQLDHENIVKFLGICVSNGSLLILMEYAQYGDLLQYLKARRHLVDGSGVDPANAGEAAHVSAPALTRMAREAAVALQYLARCGLVHRDVRAANCLIDERRTLKLADFGMARKLCDNLEYTSIRRTIFPVLWMAPESLSRGTFSTASDVWALGVLCLELVTLGSRPYGARSPHQVLAYVRHGGHPPLPPDVSPQTISLVMACWQHKAAERATANEVARYLSRETCALRPALLPAPDFAPDIPMADQTGPDLTWRPYH